MKILILTTSLVCATPFVASLFADSLWTAPGSRERPMTADHTASAIGDILTVVVQETASSQASQTKTTSNSSSVDASVDQFLFPASLSSFGTYKGALPAIKLGGGSDSTGTGAVNSTQAVSGRAAVLVTDVMPNGNLVIEGVRRVTFENETRHMVLHGIVRPEDVTSANLVYSSNIADARVEFISEGSVAEAQRKGWLTRLYDAVRPY